MGKYVELLKITDEEINRVKHNSPMFLPLNPTAQGYSGQDVRKKLYTAICGDDGSVLSLLMDRVQRLGEFLDIVIPNGELTGENISALLTKKVITFDENNNVIITNMADFYSDFNPIASKKYVDEELKNKANIFTNENDEIIDLKNVYEETNKKANIIEENGKKIDLIDVLNSQKNIIRTCTEIPNDLKPNEYIFKEVK